MSEPPVDLLPIAVDDASRVAEFLHRTLNPGVAQDKWRSLIETPWAEGPDHGFRLVDELGRVVGAYVAIYSRRGDVRVCNLAAFSVIESYRSHSIRLLRSVVRQRRVVLTDLSPSGPVPAINERLGFSHLDTATRLVLNAGRPMRGVFATSDPAEIGRRLTGRDAEVFADHRTAPAARHLMLSRGNDHAYLMYRRDRRKKLPLFASPLFVGGDTELLRAVWPAVASHLLRNGLPAFLGERRVLGFEPPGLGRTLVKPRPKMFKGAIDPTEVDYLYSELTLLEW